MQLSITMLLLSRFFHGKDDGQLWWFGKNSMFFDLGYNNLEEDDDYIATAIEEIDGIFDLILITEYFDQSLILMKELLSWNWEDVLYIKVNSRTQVQSHGLHEHRLLVEKTRQWTKADAYLYDYFNSTLWKKIKLYGEERMKLDLQELSKRNKNLKEKCILNEVKNIEVEDPQNRVDNPQDIDMMGYILKPNAKNSTLCQGLIRSEVPWFKYLLNKQRKMVPRTF